MSEISPAQAFMLTRRSRPFRLLKKPVPSRGQLEIMLTIAARTPDHGKLEPWRFVVLQEAALRRIAPIAGNTCTCTISISGYPGVQCTTFWPRRICLSMSVAPT